MLNNLESLGLWDLVKLDLNIWIEILSRCWIGLVIIIIIALFVENVIN